MNINKIGVNMSVSASIEINLSGTDSFNIMLNLLNAGWVFNDNGYQTYLPVGDNDDWDWRSEKLTNEQLLSIIEKKQQLNEVIGVGLTWGDTGRGGELILGIDNSLMFNISNNRLINDYFLTDFDWYLRKLIHALDTGNILIQSVKFEEYK